MKGDRITTLSHLWALARARRAVCYQWGVPEIAVKPAAFVLNYTGHQIQMLFDRGMWVYFKEVKP